MVPSGIFEVFGVILQVMFGGPNAPDYGGDPLPPVPK